MVSYHIEKIATGSKQGKSYRCRIRERRNGVSTINKSKFFNTKKVAETWGNEKSQIELFHTRNSSILHSTSRKLNSHQRVM